MSDSSNSTSLGLRMGLYGGLAAITFYLILYFIDKQWLVGVLAIGPMPLPVLNVLVLLPILVMQALTAWLYIKQGGDRSSIRNIIKPIFLSSIIAMLLWNNFHVLMMNYVDPQLQELAKIENTSLEVKRMEYAGALDYDIEVKKEELAELDYSYSIQRWFHEYVKSLLPAFIYSLIIATIVLFGFRPKEQE